MAGFRHGPFRSFGAAPVEAGPLQRLSMGPGATTGDGPSWFYGNNSLSMLWDFPTFGGEWLDASGALNGTNHFNMVTFNGTVYDWAVNIGPLVQKLLTDGNTGIFLKTTPPPSEWAFAPRIASYRHATQPGATLQVVTTNGTFNPPLIEDCCVIFNDVRCIIDPDLYLVGGMLKFDLSGVTGSVTSATLTPTHTSNGTLAPIAVDYLALPRIYDNLRVQKPANIEQGLAASYPADVGLKDDPAIIWHPRMDSTVNWFADWLGQFHDPAGEPGNLPWVDQNSQTGGPGAYDRWGYPWSDGIKNFRAISQSVTPPYILPIDLGGTILGTTWRKYVGGIGSYPAGYYRYLVEWEPSMQAGNNIGGKMPGMVDDIREYDLRGSFTKQSVINPGHTLFLNYVYDSEGSAVVLPFNLYPMMKHGRRHCIEMFIQLNTKSGGVWNYDGVIKWWVDGYKLYETFNRRIVNSGSDPAYLYQVSANFFHGGAFVAPTVPIFLKYGGVYFSTAYIGPPTTMP